MYNDMPENNRGSHRTDVSPTRQAPGSTPQKQARGRGHVLGTDDQMQPALRQDPSTSAARQDAQDTSW